MKTSGDAEVARREADELVNVQRLGGLLAASGFFADAREMAQAAVKVLAGRELGIPPVAAMMGINIIKGKVALGGNLIASRIRAHGYDFRHKQFDDKGCVLVFLSKIEDGKRTVLGESSFTAADAERAQISSDMYRKYPRNMYFNRAISNGAKWYCAEVFAGAPVYTPEELGADVDEEGEVIHSEGQSNRKAYKAADDDLPAEIEPLPEPTPIDTGGQPVGTKAAAQAVAEREIRQGQGAPSVEAKPEITDEITRLWRRMTDKTSCIAEIRVLKDRLTAAMGPGGDTEYYRILQDFDVRHANEFKSIEKARQCAQKLLGAAKQAESLHVQDSDAEVLN